MKIVFPLIAPRPGGASVYVEQLQYGLHKFGVDLKVNCYTHKFEYCPFLLNLTRKNFREFDIVHTDLENGIQFKDSNKPLICTAQSPRTMVSDFAPLGYATAMQKLYYRALRVNTKLSVKYADCVITVSEFCKKQLIKEYGANNKIVTIYNGVDITKFRPLNIQRDTNKIRLLFVGNLIRRKGIDLLWEIIQRLGAGFELRLIGGLDTTLVVPFKSDNVLASPGGLSNQQLVQEYNSCDIFIFPSRLETFGYSVAEAMACGKPIIATACSSLPELVDNELGGFLCEMDNVDDFIAKVKILAKSSSLRDEMGQYNRRKAMRDFDIEKCIEKYFSVYNEVLQ